MKKGLHKPFFIDRPPCTDFNTKNFDESVDIGQYVCYTIITKRKGENKMYRLIHIESGFEFSFTTLEEAIEYLETYEMQEEFEIRR